jgi:hypothetical protein
MKQLCRNRTDRYTGWVIASAQSSAKFTIQYSGNVVLGILALSLVDAIADEGRIETLIRRYFYRPLWDGRRSEFPKPSRWKSGSGMLSAKATGDSAEWLSAETGAIKRRSSADRHSNGNCFPCGILSKTSPRMKVLFFGDESQVSLYGHLRPR